MADAVTRLPEELARFGVQPEQVDVVVHTHLHVDHVGWDGVFSEARYVIPRADWAFFMSDESLEQRPHLREKVKPLGDAGLVDLVDGETEVSPGIRIVPAPGHTPGHAIVWIESQGSALAMLGDAVAHEAQVADPDLVFVNDHDPSLAAETRRAVLGRLADEGTDVIVSHFHGAGRFERVREGFSWTALGKGASGARRIEAHALWQRLIIVGVVCCSRSWWRGRPSHRAPRSPAGGDDALPRCRDAACTTAIIFVGLLSALLVIPQVRAVAGGLLASSAVIGIVVGFASQRTLGNFVAGLLIAFTQPLRLGDYVGSRVYKGMVEEIGLIYTFVRVDDNDRLVIPNEKLASDTIRNSTIRSREKVAANHHPGTTRERSRRRRGPSDREWSTAPRPTSVDLADNAAGLRVRARAEDEPPPSGSSMSSASARMRDCERPVCFA